MNRHPTKRQVYPAVSGRKPTHSGKPHFAAVRETNLREVSRKDAKMDRRLDFNDPSTTSRLCVFAALRETNFREVSRKGAKTPRWTAASTSTTRPQRRAFASSRLCAKQTSARFRAKTPRWTAASTSPTRPQRRAFARNKLPRGFAQRRKDAKMDPLLPLTGPSATSRLCVFAALRETNLREVSRKGAKTPRWTGSMQVRGDAPLP
jgi:hypothetical protein